MDTVGQACNAVVGPCSGNGGNLSCTLLKCGMIFEILQTVLERPKGILICDI